MLVLLVVLAFVLVIGALAFPEVRAGGTGETMASLDRALRRSWPSEQRSAGTRGEAVRWTRADRAARR